ncbi:MAG: hypothetical protein IKW19_06890, partial [Akkermansia sp.]|nr:hypothetical protein [Akkermansia sp.]
RMRAPSALRKSCRAVFSFSVLLSVMRVQFYTYIIHCSSANNAMKLIFEGGKRNTPAEAGSAGV